MLKQPSLKIIPLWSSKVGGQVENDLEFGVSDHRPKYPLLLSFIIKEKMIFLAGNYRLENIMEVELLETMFYSIRI